MKTQTLAIGDRVLFDDDEHDVIGIAGACVRLRSETGASQLVLAAALFAAPGFRKLDAPADVSPEVSNAKDFEALADSVGPEQAARARRLHAEFLEMTTGYKEDFRPPEAPDKPPRPAPALNPIYDVSIPISERVRTKAQELRISERQLWRKLEKWQEAGVYGLVDGRATKGVHPLKNIDFKVQQAIVDQARAETGESTGTRNRFMRRVEARLATTHPDEVIPMPSKSAFYRATNALLNKQYTFGDAPLRRNRGNAPQGGFRITTATRPGEFVLMDTTVLDIHVADPQDGTPTNAELTIALDLATRSILSWRFTPPGTKAVDAVLLLADAVTPEPMRPAWSDSLRYSMMKVPFQRLMTRDERLRAAAARPVIIPETLVIDNGRIYVSEAFLSGAKRLGISVQKGRPGQPTDKAQVERTFGSIRTLFSEHVSGYKGRSVSTRGEKLEGQTVWTVAELEEIFAEWVVAVWQRRRHDGLLLPGFPEVRLSPNDAYAEAVSRAGMMTCPVPANLYMELLPIKWRHIQPQGVFISGLYYDGDSLDGITLDDGSKTTSLRQVRSGHSARNGKWPFHQDPRDVSRVYFLHPQDNRWHALAWTHMPAEAHPFSDTTARWVKRTITERGENPTDQEAVAGALLALQSRTDLDANSRRRLRRDYDRARAVLRDAERFAADHVPATERFPVTEDFLMQEAIDEESDYEDMDLDAIVAATTDEEE